MIVAEKKKDSWGLVMRTTIKDTFYRAGEKAP